MARAGTAMTDRERILGRLRSTRGYLPAVAAAPPHELAAASLDECVSRFLVEAAALGIDCHVEATDAAVQHRVEALSRGQTVLAWNPEHVPYNALAHVTNVRFGNASRAAQAVAQIGVTGCDAAIAETASLVLFSGPGRSRAVSLLPPVHLAVVARSSLCFTMAEMFATHAPRFRDSAACTVITGPSRTADIELTLTLGIHGPGRVIVVLGP